MKLLAWDTSGRTGAIGALEWDEEVFPRVVGEWVLDSRAQHAEHLLWGIEHLLQSVRWKLTDVDVFGVGIGPGSFTGIRIGLTTARTIAHELQKPLVGVSSLAALARPVTESLTLAEHPALLLVAQEACKGEVYGLWGQAGHIRDCVALAEGDHPGLWKRGVSEDVYTPEDLVARIQAKLKDSKRESMQWAFLGDAREKYSELWKKLPASKELKIPGFFQSGIQGRAVAVLAWEGFQAGLARDALKVHPRYLRASDAELKLKSGKLKPAPTD